MYLRVQLFGDDVVLIFVATSVKVRYFIWTGTQHCHLNVMFKALYVRALLSLLHCIIQCAITARTPVMHPGSTVNMPLRYAVPTWRSAAVHQVTVRDGGPANAAHGTTWCGFRLSRRIQSLPHSDTTRRASSWQVNVILGIPGPAVDMKYCVTGNTAPNFSAIPKKWGLFW